MAVDTPIFIGTVTTSTIEAGSECSDAQMVAGRAGAALVVTRQDTSHVNHVHNLIGALNEARVHLVGTVLNNF